MHIALFLPNWIGDVVMATPAIRALTQTYPDARFTAVARPYIDGVLDGATWFHQRIAADQNCLAVAAQLRRDRADLAVIFPNSFRTAWIARLGRCRRRIGYARHGRSLLLTDRLQPVRDARGRIKPSPILLAYNRLARAAGCNELTTRMELFTTAADDEAAAGVWQSTGLDQLTTVYCLNPGAAFGSAKLWPAEHFAALALRLVRQAHSGVLVLCGPSERALARRIADRAGHPRVHSLADHAVSIGLTKACIRRSDLIVTTDSGPRHIAAAFNRPVVALFGPTHIAWTDTFYPHEIQLQKRVPCGPCQLRTCPLDHRCMTELTPDEVFAAVEQLRNRIPILVAGEQRRAG